MNTHTSFFLSQFHNSFVVPNKVSPICWMERKEMNETNKPKNH